MTFHPKFVRRVPGFLSADDDGAGRQPTRGPRYETGGPRQSLHDPAEWTRRTRPPATPGTTPPREGGSFTVPPPSTQAGAEARPSRDIAKSQRKSREGGPFPIPPSGPPYPPRRDQSSPAGSNLLGYPREGSESLFAHLDRADAYPIAVPHYGRRGFKAAKVLGRIEAPRINPLDELALKFRTMTYGELKAFAAILFRAAPAREITQDEIPAMFHGLAEEAI